MILLFCLEALEYVKKIHFTEKNEIGFKPFCGLVRVTGRSLMVIGHLLVASITNGGPTPGFLVPWVYHYVIDGLDSVSSFLSSRVNDRTLCSTAYNEVKINF